MRIKVPSEFKISGMPHTVERVKDMVDDHNLYGQSVYKNRHIKIDEKLQGAQAQETFLHEAIHHIDDLYDRDSRKAR